MAELNPHRNTRRGASDARCGGAPSPGGLREQTLARGPIRPRSLARLLTFGASQEPLLGQKWTLGPPHPPA